MRIQGVQVGGKTPTDIGRSLQSFSDEVKRVLNKQLTFNDNLDIVEVTHTFTTTDTEEAIAHTLKRVPVRYVVIKKDSAGDVYDGDTANTDALIYLKCEVAASVVLLIY